MDWNSYIGGVFTATLVGAVGVVAQIPTFEPGNTGEEIPTFGESNIENFEPPSNSSTTKRKRHTITLTLTSTDDLKVSEGDVIEVGTILSDRTRERERLEARKKQLEISINAQRIPLPELPPPTPPNYSIQVNNINRAKYRLDQLENRPEPLYRFKTQELREVFDKDVIKAEAKAKEQELIAAINYEQSINRLAAARDRYQSKQYQYAVEATRSQVDRQEQEFRLASLTAQLQEVESALEEITTVRSPYPGTVRRVRILNQSNRTITAEVIIDVEESP
jgi:biotin carboxyl carrier protein